MTAETAIPPRTGATAPGFFSTFASEWTKLTSVRSTFIIVALAVVLSIGMTALITAATGSTWDEWNERDRAEFDPVLFSIFGSIFSGILVIVLGVLAMASEYSSGMIRLTFTVTPKRRRVLAAKVAVVTVITWVVGAVATLGMFFTGQAILGGFDMPTASLGDTDALRTVGTITATTPFFALIGLTLAVVLRSTAGAITTALAVMLAPAIFGGLLPRWWQEHIIALSPSSVSDALALGHLDDSPMYLSAPAATAMLVVWLVLFVGAAHLLLNRRDA